MNRRKRVAVCLLLAICLLWGACLPCALSEDATSYSYALSGDGSWRVTQDTYCPAGVLFREEGLKNPEDICCFENVLYVADTGNGRVLRFDIESGNYREVAPGLFSSPTGVYANELGLFVADRGSAEAYWLDQEENLVRTYIRPESASYGENNVYLPMKIAADSQANVYVLSAGTYHGLVQFDREGEFTGFFATNATRLSVKQWLQYVFFTDEQKAKLFDITPVSFNNLTIRQDEGLVYTLTPESMQGVKLHSVAGGNILSAYTRGEGRFEDIALGNGNRIFVVTASGIVYVYTAAGEVLFSFGGQAVAADVAGYATVVSGIAVDNHDCVYLLDRQRGFVHSYIPTRFSSMIYQALSMSDDGKYAEGAQLWDRVLKLAPDFPVAYNAMAASAMRQGKWEEAREAYRRADNREGYSDAQWELRNVWIGRHFSSILILTVSVSVILWGVKRILRRTGLDGKLRGKVKTLFGGKMCVELGMVFYTIRHPMDVWFYVKREQRCSTASACVIYALSYLVFVLDRAGMGYVFNTADLEHTSPFYYAVVFFLPLALWVVCGYMVSSVMYGEGRLRAVFIGGAYMLSPYLVFMPILVLLSHGLTLNEAFVIEFGTVLVWSWVALLLFLSVKEVHNYTPKRTLGAISVTLFFIIIVIVAAAIVYMLCHEAADMAVTVVKEALYRV